MDVGIIFLNHSLFVKYIWVFSKSVTDVSGREVGILLLKSAPARAEAVLQSWSTRAPWSEERDTEGHVKEASAQLPACPRAGG